MMIRKNHLEQGQYNFRILHTNLIIIEFFNLEKKFDFTNLRCQKRVDLERATLSIGSLGGGEEIATVLVNN